MCLDGGAELFGVGAGDAFEDGAVAEEDKVGDGGDIIGLGDVGELFGVNGEEVGGWGGGGGERFEDSVSSWVSLGSWR